jgi:hypothetical protein
MDSERKRRLIGTGLEKKALEVHESEDDAKQSEVDAMSD